MFFGWLVGIWKKKRLHALVNNRQISTLDLLKEFLGLIDNSKVRRTMAKGILAWKISRFYAKPGFDRVFSSVDSTVIDFDRHRLD